jgi:hypothetical protein
MQGFSIPTKIAVSSNNRVPYTKIVNLRNALTKGWKLDLFSTFLSRKSYQHKLIGPFHLYRMPKKGEIMAYLIINDYGDIKKTIHLTPELKEDCENGYIQLIRLDDGPSELYHNGKEWNWHPIKEI